MKKIKLVKNGLLVVAAVLLLTAFSKETAFAKVKTMSDGGLFDPSYYAATYPDLYKAFGMNEKMLYQHFLTYGRNEGRKPYAGYVAPKPTDGVIVMSDGGLFDPKYYADKNPDVVKVYGKADKALYQHYLDYGKKEGRKPYADYNSKEEQKLKLKFETSGNVTTEAEKLPDVVVAIRQAAKFKVEETIFNTEDFDDVSADEITALVEGQRSYIKKTYGATIKSITPMVYGSTDNLKVQVIVKLKF